VAGGGRTPEPPSVTLVMFALPAAAAIGGKNYNVNKLTTTPYDTSHSIVENAAYAFSPAWHAIAIKI